MHANLNRFSLSFTESSSLGPFKMSEGEILAWKHRFWERKGLNDEVIQKMTFCLYL